MAEQDSPKLVESGSFRIDRARALEKLRDFQLPDPSLYAAVLVRCAVASAASEIRFDAPARETGVEVSFDGRPFSAEELEYPYGALLAGAEPETDRNRELAIALLALLRFKPARILVRSGAPGSRFQLTIDSLDSESLTRSDDPGTKTIVRAVAKGILCAFWEPEVHKRLRGDCRFSPIPVTFGEFATARVGLDACRDDELSFKAGGIRGRLEPLPALHPTSTVWAARYGVEIGALELPVLKVPVEGWVNDDRLTLNASQSGVVRNDGYSRVVELIVRQSERLLEKVIGLQNRRMAQLGPRILKPNPAALWRDRVELVTGVGENFLRIPKLAWGALQGLVDKTSIEGVVADAERARWLRLAARALLGAFDKDCSDPPRKRLWEAALFFDVQGAPLSLSELELQRRRLGIVPYSSLPSPGYAPAFRVAYALAPVELEQLRAHFGFALTDVRAFLESEPRRGPKWSMRALGKDRSADPALDRVGCWSLLARKSFKSGALSGEVGLASHRPERGALVHLFKMGRPAAFAEIPGPLRYAAALSGLKLADFEQDPGGATELSKELLAAPEQAALDLYKEAARDYEPRWDLPRHEALRQHLFDFLAWACAREERVARLHPWIAAVGLFRHAEGFWDYRRLQNAYAGGETLLFARAPVKGVPKELLFVDPRFTEPFLRALFPSANLRAHPGRPELLIVSSSLAEDCGHTSTKDCLIEWREPGRPPWHLAAGSGAGGAGIKMPWGELRAFGAQGLPAALGDEAGLLLLEALLRQRGTRHEAPLHPERRFVLAALRHFFAPWPKFALSPVAERARALLEGLPLFPSGRETAWTPGELSSLTASRHLSLAIGGDPKTSHADLSLTAEEYALFGFMWPKLAESIVPERTAPSAPLPPTAPGASPDQLPLSFSSAMVYQSELRHDGLRALFGLPPEPLPGLATAIHRGGRLSHYTVDSKSPAAAGAAEVDASAWPGPIDGGPGIEPAFRAALLSLYHRFLTGLLDAWPGLSASDQDALAPYLLNFLRDPAPEWAVLQGRIRGIALLPTAGGGRVSLVALERRVAEDGALIYLKASSAGLPEEARDIPVLRFVRLTSAALGGAKTAEYSMPAEKFAAQSAAACALPPAEGAPKRLAELLRALYRRRGLDFRACPPPETVSFIKESGRRLLPRLALGSWQVDTAHPLAAELLAAKLAPREQAAYLASLVYSDANRRHEAISDADDMSFQEALAERLLEEL